MSILFTCMCITYVPGTQGGEKRVLDTPRLELPLCGCWELNLSPVEQQYFFNPGAISPVPSFLC